MYCKKCGKELPNDAKFCPNCGDSIVEFSNDINNRVYEHVSINKHNDNYAVAWGILSFFVPFVGLILWIVWRETDYKNAKAAGLGALISIIMRTIITIISVTCYCIFNAQYIFN